MITNQETKRIYTMKTLYMEYQDLETEYEKMRFFFKHAIAWRSYKVTKAKMGVYIKGILEKTYAEIDGDFILLYPVEGNKIGQCKGEIILRDFVANLKHTHELLTKD